MPPTSLTILLDRLRTDPTDHELHLRLGDLYAAREPDRAVDAYLRSARLLASGDRLDRPRRASRAADILSRAIPLAANPTTVELNLAELLEIADRATEAEPIYRRLVQRAAFADRPLAQLALFERLATLSPLDLDHRHRTAKALSSLGLTDVAAYELAAIAELELAALRPHAAVATIEHAVALAPRAPELHELRARILADTVGHATDAWDAAARGWRAAHGRAARRPRGSLLIVVDEPFLRERLSALAVRLGLVPTTDPHDTVRIAVREQTAHRELPDPWIAELHSRTPGLPIVWVRRGGAPTTGDRREWENLGVSVWTPARPLLDLAALIIGAAATGESADPAAEADGFGVELDAMRDRLAETATELTEARAAADAAIAVSDDLRSRLTVHGEQLAEARAALAARTAAAHEADARMLELTAELGARDQQIGPLRARLSFAETHARELESSLRTAEAARDRLTAERDVLAVELAQTAATNGQAAIDLSRTTAERDQLAVERERATVLLTRTATELTAVTTERDRLATGLRQVTAERQQLVAERDDLTVERNRLGGELRQVSHDRRQIVAARDALTAERDQLQSELRQVTAERQQYLAERETVTAAHAQLATQVAAITADAALHRDRATRIQSLLREERDAAATTAHALEQRLGVETAAAAARHGRVVERMTLLVDRLTRERRRRRTAEEAARGQARLHRRLDDTRERAVAARAAFAERLRAVGHELDERTTERTQLHAQLDTAQREIGLLRERAAAGDRSATEALSLRQNLSAAQGRFVDLAAAAEESRLELDRLRSEYAAAERTIAATSAALGSATGAIAAGDAERARLLTERDAAANRAEAEQLAGQELRRDLEATRLAADEVSAELESLRVRADGLLREVERWRNDAARDAGRHFSPGWLAALVLGSALAGGAVINRFVGSEPGLPTAAPADRSSGRSPQSASPAAAREIRFYTLGEYAAQERALVRREDRPGYSAKAKLHTREEARAYYGYQGTVLGWDLARLTHAVQSPTGELRTTFRFVERTYIDVTVENLGLDTSFDINTIASSFNLRIGDRIERARVSRDEQPNLLGSTSGPPRVESISMRLEFSIPTTDGPLTLEFRPPNGEPSTFIWEQR